MSEKPCSITIGTHKRPVIRRPTTTYRNNVSASQPISISAKSSLTKLSRTSSTASIKNRQPQPEQQQVKTADSTLDDQECINIRNNVMQTGDLSQVSDQDLTKLHSHLREYVADCSMNEQYDEAQKAYNLAELSKQEIQTRSKSALPSECSVQSTSQQREEIEKDYQQKIQDLNQRLDQKIQTLQEKHKQETEQFENVWIEEMPRKYRKPSQKLLELKEMERNLALANNFDGAKRIHSEVQALADIETQNAQRALVKDYRTYKKQMEKRMERDLDNIENIRQRQTTFLETQKEKRLDELANRDKVLQQKKSESEHEKSSSQSLQIAPTYAGSRKRDSIHKNLLGELKPPNDKSILEQERKENNERKRRQAEFQKKLNFSKKSPEKQENLESYKNITAPSPKTFNEEVMEVEEKIRESHNDQDNEQNQEQQQEQPQEQNGQPPQQQNEQIQNENQQNENNEPQNQQEPPPQNTGQVSLGASLRQAVEERLEDNDPEKDGFHKSQETQI